MARFASAGWQLWRAYELAAESREHKDEFIAMLAHELKNPLAAIINTQEVARKISGNDADLLRTDLPEADWLQAESFITRLTSWDGRLAIYRVWSMT